MAGHDYQYSQQFSYLAIHISCPIKSTFRDTDRPGFLYKSVDTISGNMSCPIAIQMVCEKDVRKFITGSGIDTSLVGLKPGLVIEISLV